MMIRAIRNEELDADHIVHDDRVMQGFAGGHIVVIGHGRQEGKLSHTQDNKKKQLSGTKIIGNCIVPRSKVYRYLGIQTVVKDF